MESLQQLTFRFDVSQVIGSDDILLHQHLHSVQTLIALQLTQKDLGFITAIEPARVIPCR